MATAEDVLAVARAEIGTYESPPNSNKQKYGAWYGWNGVPWCMIFVQYCFAMAGAAIPFRTASCTSLMNYAKKVGRWVEGDFLPGDVMIMQFKDGRHTGILEKSDGSGIFVCIEGNTSYKSDDNGGEVMRRTRYASNIMGAYRPELEEDMTEAEVRRIVQSVLMEQQAKQEAAEPSAWSQADREWAEQMGIIAGDGKGNYKYCSFTTREQMVAFLHRLYNICESGVKAAIAALLKAE